MISLDTETTGVDFKHGSRPFFVTICNDEGENTWWEWDVNPLTREVIIPSKDIRDIQDRLDVVSGWGKNFDPEIAHRHKVCLQNPKFDVTALSSIGIINFPWHQTLDTLMAGHLLASGLPHDLTAMTLQYLGEDIKPFEDRLGLAVQDCRRKCRLHYKDWAIADHDRDDMPSCPASKKDTAARGNDRDTAWKFDMWLPKALAEATDLPRPDPECDHVDEKTGASTWGTDSICRKCKGHRYWIILSEYSNVDSAVTLPLMKVMIREMKEKGYWKVYKERLKLLPVYHGIETYGLGYHLDRAQELKTEYEPELERCRNICVNLASAKDYELVLPKPGAMNASLRSFLFDTLQLEPIRGVKSKTDNPSFDKEVVRHYLGTLDRNSIGYSVVKALSQERIYAKDLAALEQYQRFAIPHGENGDALIYCSFNPTGTAHLRASSSNPNGTNIGKQEDECEACEGEGCNACNGTGVTRRSMRYCFGPKPGREWWSLDYSNIERRIPAYEANEEEIIALFERPNDAPYFGSEHLLVAHILHPKLFEETCRVTGGLDGRLFKKKFKATWYQWIKNGNYSLQYGAGVYTADRTYRVPGARALLKSRFNRQEGLNQYWINHAERTGLVYTIPDREVDPKQGYPLMCNRSGWGNISPTIPLNYHTSGSACWVKGKAMVKCEERLQQWRQNGFDGYLVLEVHDELVFDFPASKHSPDKSHLDGLFTRGKSNLWRAKQLQGLMEKEGDNIGLPTPVNCEYHPDNWSVGISF